MNRRKSILFLTVFTLTASFIFSDGEIGKNYINADFLSSSEFSFKPDKKKEDESVSKLSDKRGSITIKGKKSDIGEDNKKYKIVLKKLYTSNSIEEKTFFNKFYEIPEYAQGIEIDDTKIIPYNRENIVVADEDGKAVMKNLLLGEYEISSAEEGTDMIVHTVRIPLLNKNEDKNFNIELIDEELNGGSVEMSVTESGIPVEGLSYGLYKAEEQVENTENSEQQDGTETEGEKIGENIASDKNGMVFVNELESGKYYFKLAEAKDGFILDNKRHYFEIDSLGKVQHNGGIKVGKVVEVRAEAYRDLYVNAKINSDNKNRKKKINLSTPFKLQYQVDIPKNIEEYSNIVFESNLSEKLNIKSMKLDVDGKTENSLNTRRDNNKISIEISDITALKGKKAINIEVQVDIREDIESKEAISNSMTSHFNLFENQYESESKKLEIIPTYGKLKLINQDKSDGMKIQGSVFQVKLDDKVVVESTTDTRGSIVWDKLPYGNLEIVQVKESKVYEEPYKLSRPVKYEMNDSKAKGGNIIVKSSKKGTGIFDKENLPYTIGITAALIIAIAMGIRKKKQNKKAKTE